MCYTTTVSRETKTTTNMGEKFFGKLFENFEEAAPALAAAALAASVYYKTKVTAKAATAAAVGSISYRTL